MLREYIFQDPYSIRDDTSSLSLDLSSDQDRDIMRAITVFKLPEVSILRLKCLKKEDFNLKIFLKEGTPDKLQWLVLEYASLDSINYYWKYLVPVLKKVTKGVCLWKVTLDEELLEKVVKACAHVEHLGINNCDLDLEPPLEFSGPVNYNIQTVSFYKTGKRYDNDWETHPSRLRYIIEGFAE